MKLSVWDHVEKYNMQQRELMLTLFSQADGIDMSFHSTIGFKG